MSLGFKAVAASIFPLALFAIAGAGSASADTICTPGFTAACPNNGTNVIQLSLEGAMNLNSSDGVADTIYMSPSTYTDPNSGGSPGTLEPLGTDDLNVIGSGTDQSIITSAGTGNQYVVNLNAGNRKVDMSNLTIVVPASFPDPADPEGPGGALQAQDGTFDHVDLKTLNDQSNGATSLIGDTVWKNSHIYGSQGVTFSNGISPGSSSGKLEITNTKIENADWGVIVDGTDTPVVMKKSRVLDPQNYGVLLSNGALFVMENSVIVGAGTHAIEADTYAGAGAADIDAQIRSSTIIGGSDPADAAIRVNINGSFGSKSADVSVTNSILRGFTNTWDMVTPAGPGIGHGSLSFTRSDFTPAGTPADSPVVDLTGPGNIDVDPMFTGPSDFHLLPGSPAIDAGDPADIGIVDDFDNGPRPLDGNGDGSRIIDMGAFEAAEIVNCLNTQSACPPPPPPPPPPADTTAPKVSKVKFRHGKSPKKGGSLKLTLSEAATVKATFKPAPAKKKGQKKRKKLKLTKKAVAGANTISIRKRKLRPGKYRLSISATDAAGNKSKTIVRKVKVKG